jgi:hypothetical protein
MRRARRCRGRFDGRPAGAEATGADELSLWMALARATPVEGWRFDEAQSALGEGTRAAPGDGLPA